MRPINLADAQGDQCQLNAPKERFVCSTIRRRSVVRKRETEPCGCNMSYRPLPTLNICALRKTRCILIDSIIKTVNATRLGKERNALSARLHMWLR